MCVRGENDFLHVIAIVCNNQHGDGHVRRGEPARRRRRLISQDKNGHSPAALTTPAPAGPSAVIRPFLLDFEWEIVVKVPFFPPSSEKPQN